MHVFSIDDVERILTQYVKIYLWRKPVYQYIALRELACLWDNTHRNMLDVGGGTGVLAQAMKCLFDLRRVASVDVKRRFLPSLSIETAVYDGTILPFPDASFDCVVIFNVLHHVPIASRILLLRECRRVAGGGPIYIKDHLSTGRLDDARLAVLDLLGNVPFHGMLRASYLTARDWRDLASEAGFESDARSSDAYRTGLFEAIFPNRLETMMKWRPLPDYGAQRPSAV
jgi:ubiquinone/menaquinone biosynthesis C-methylase UbiE